MTTTTASSIPTSNPHHSWQSVRKELFKEIMNTDILCEIMFPEGQADEAAAKLEEVFVMMRTFEKRYSRFIDGNELSRFNHSTAMVLSPEFFDILRQAQHFYQFTNTLFDPSILPALEAIGYHGARHTQGPPIKTAFSQLILDPHTHTATKPKGLLIDLGGIGKGYIVDQVARLLAKHFQHFLIDAGGDIYVQGANVKKKYPYWAISVEHPETHAEAALLLLSDMAVATSGRNRRLFTTAGVKKHHLIDPRTNTSAALDYQSVTVLAHNTMTADVLAKALFIAGKKQAPILAETWRTPAIFVDENGAVTINHFAQPYVWKTL